MGDKPMQAMIDIEVTPDQKYLLEQGCKIKNISLSEYMLSSSLKWALDDLKESEKVLLSDEDRDRVIFALENPPLPNDALKALF